jgi:hypothetical protein
MGNEHALWVVGDGYFFYAVLYHVLRNHELPQQIFKFQKASKALMLLASTRAD